MAEVHDFSRVVQFTATATSTEVAGFDLPPGNYALTAIVDVSSGRNTIIECTLEAQQPGFANQQTGLFSGWSQLGLVDGHIVLMLDVYVSGHVDVACHSPIVDFATVRTVRIRAIAASPIHYH